MPKYSSDTLSVALGTKPVALSCGDYTITVTLPEFPAFSAAALDKKVALRTALNAITPHKPYLTPTALVQAFSPLLPIPLEATDTECQIICTAIRKALTRPGHPGVSHTALDFLNPTGHPVSASFSTADLEKASQHQGKCLRYVTIEATTASLASFHPCLQALGPATATFTLSLPQSPPPVSTIASAAGARNLAGSLAAADGPDSTATRTPVAQPTASVPPIPASMRSCVSPAGTNRHRNYYGAFDFLESPAAFLSTFGPTDPVLPAASDRTRHPTSSTPGALPNSLAALLRDCYSICPAPTLFAIRLRRR
eukprot:scaffold5987_cov203-Amphora_coffeaeformis.AAC.1